MFTEGVFEKLDLALEEVKSRSDVADASDVSELQQMFRDPRWQAMAKVIAAGLLHCLIQSVSVCLSACLLVVCACVRGRGSGRSHAIRLPCGVL